MKMRCWSQRNWHGGAKNIRVTRKSDENVSCGFSGRTCQIVEIECEHCSQLRAKTFIQSDIQRLDG